MRNKIIFEDIQKCQNILLFSGVAKGLSQGKKPGQKGPTAHYTGSTSQHSEKNLRNDGESGCGWLN